MIRRATTVPSLRWASRHHNNNNNNNNNMAYRKMMQPLRLLPATTTGSSSAYAGITTTSFILPDPSVDTSHHVRNLQLTKIVATIGPTSEQAAPLLSVTNAGMRIMRLNFSHATPAEVQLRTTNLAAAQKQLTPPGASTLQDVRAILLDTKGPEIRSGKLAGDTSGHHTVRLTAGQVITLHTLPIESGSTASDLFIDYPSLHKAVHTGSRVLLDDGAIGLTVVSIDHDSGSNTVQCRIDNTGDLRSRAGVNLPLADTSDLPAMSAKDKADIKYGMQSADIDFVAASFVQTAQHVRDIRAHIAACAAELGWTGHNNKPLPKIISKIETAGALQHFDQILLESDGIMVARGDLGVEIPLQQVTNAQKEMIAACNAAGKPVVVATQMLESMSKNPRPTRAEVSDVTNAVYDGADAVMTSGETAKGQYPTETIKMMNEIIRSAERYATSGALASTSRKTATVFTSKTNSAEAAIAKAAVSAVSERKCAAILVIDSAKAPAGSASVPQLVAAFRPSVPILAFCSSPKVGRQWQIYRGIHPIVVAPTATKDGNGDKRTEQAIQEAKQMGYLHAGDEVVIVLHQEETSIGDTVSMKIATVP